MGGKEWIRETMETLSVASSGSQGKGDLSEACGGGVGPGHGKWYWFTVIVEKGRGSL